MFQNVLFVLFSKLKCHFHFIFVGPAFVCVCKNNSSRKKHVGKILMKNSAAKTGTKTCVFLNRRAKK